MNLTQSQQSVLASPPQTEAMLHVVMYHYVRDLWRTPFPRIKGLLINEFRRQVAALCTQYEMVTLDVAHEFLAGRYVPRRDLCLLTFDDGLRDHYEEVCPLLVDRGIQGLFFLITGALEERQVAAVHKNHFLLAALDFGKYCAAFLDVLAELRPQLSLTPDPAAALRTYRWDSPEVAEFKYLINFQLDGITKDQVLSKLFQQHFGDESAFAAELYLTWEEARQMQTAGMLMGGHTHRHLALAGMSEEAARDDLQQCRQLLRSRLQFQERWPFSYPFGKAGTSFHAETIATLKSLGFCCAFSTEVGANPCDQDPFVLRRTDPKDVHVHLPAQVAASSL